MPKIVWWVSKSSHTLMHKSWLWQGSSVDWPTQLSPYKLWDPHHLKCIIDFHLGCASSLGLLVFWVIFAIEKLNLCPKKMKKTKQKNKKNQVPQHLWIWCEVLWGLSSSCGPPSTGCLMPTKFQSPLCVPTSGPCPQVSQHPLTKHVLLIRLWIWWVILGPPYIRDHF